MIYSPIYLGYSIYIVVKHKLKDMMSCKELWNSKESIVVTSGLVQTFLLKLNAIPFVYKTKPGVGEKERKRSLIV